MSNTEPDFCEPYGDPGVIGIPNLPGPCIDDNSCIGSKSLSDTGGNLGLFARLLGSATKAFTKSLSVTEEELRPGVLRCFVDSDGKVAGVGINFHQGAQPVEFECLDEDGVNQYRNGVRPIRQADGTYALGTLPPPLNGSTCAESSSDCASFYPPDEEGAVYGSTSDGDCGPTVSVSVPNTSCWPMIVRPSVTIYDAKLGSECPVALEVQPNVNGEFGAQRTFLASPYQACSMQSAGSGDTDPASSGQTLAGGADNHTHDIDDHVHGGPAHTHTLNCTGSCSFYSGTIQFPPVVIAPGATFNSSYKFSLRYLGDCEEPGQLNWGTVMACADYTSQVDSTTIEAIEIPVVTP